MTRMQSDLRGDAVALATFYRDNVDETTGASYLEDIEEAGSDSMLEEMFNEISEDMETEGYELSDQERILYGARQA